MVYNPGKGMVLRLLFTVSGAAALLWSRGYIERSLIYTANNDLVEPEEFGIPAIRVTLRTRDHEALSARWIPNPNPKAVPAILFSGRRGFRPTHIVSLKALWECDCSILLLHYRGFGESSGSPTENGLITDGLTAYDWVRKRVGGGKPIVLYGRSLGGAVAAQVALRRPVAALVLESTFTSIPAMARNLTNVPGVEKILKTNFDTLSAVKQLDIPLMIVHGSEDKFVPFHMARSLFNASASENKVLHRVDGGRHNTTHYSASEPFRKWFTELRAQLTSGGAAVRSPTEKPNRRTP
jgi:fermentation-respiration switch protein FrsA (DUF1100 family)